VTEHVYLGLGSNVGDSLETLTAAVLALDDVDGFALDDVSGVYETPPWGGVDQEPFLNLVVGGLTTLDPDALLTETQLIEAAFGRDRAREVRWGPRRLDIDLLLVGDRTVDSDRLTLPHPRIAERAFVLVPLLEVMPGGSLPDGRRLTALLAALAPIEGIDLVVRLDDLVPRGTPRPQGPDGGPATFVRPGSDAVANEHGRPDGSATETEGRAS